MLVPAPVTCPRALGPAASHGHPSPSSGSKALHREGCPGAWSPALGSFCALKLSRPDPKGRSKLPAQLAGVLQGFSTQAKEVEQTLLCESHCLAKH